MRCDLFDVTRATRSLALLLVVGLAPRALAQEYTPQNSLITGKHSVVVARGGNIRDDDLATMLRPLLIDNAGNAKAKDAKFIFTQCFGGGLFDEIDAEIGNKLPWVGGSAANGSEPSWGTGNANAGINYWSNELFKDYDASKTLLQNLDRARLNDPVGVNKTGATPTKLPNGTPVQEHPQDLSRNGGNTINLRDATAASHHAILFAGNPNKYRHFDDVMRMRDRLITEWGASGAPYTIDILFGDGLKNSKGDNLPDAWNAKAATQAKLQESIDAIVPNMSPNEQFLLFISDHGDTRSVVVDDRIVIPGGGTAVASLTMTAGELYGMREDKENIPQWLLTGSFSPGTLTITVDSFSQLYALSGGSSPLALDFSEDPFFDPMGTLTDRTFSVSFAFSGSGSITIDTAEFDLGGIDNLVAPVPEPTTFVAVGAGLAALLRRRRR